MLLAQLALTAVCRPAADARARSWPASGARAMSMQTRQVRSRLPACQAGARAGDSDLHRATQYLALVFELAPSLGRPCLLSGLVRGPHSPRRAADGGMQRHTRWHAARQRRCVGGGQASRRPIRGASHGRVAARPHKRAPGIGRRAQRHRWGEPAPRLRRKGAGLRRARRGVAAVAVRGGAGEHPARPRPQPRFVQPRVNPCEVAHLRRRALLRLSQRPKVLRAPPLILARRSTSRALFFELQQGSRLRRVRCASTGSGGYPGSWRGKAARDARAPVSGEAGGRAPWTPPAPPFALIPRGPPRVRGPSGSTWFASPSARSAGHIRAHSAWRSMCTRHRASGACAACAAGKHRRYSGTSGGGVGARMDSQRNPIKPAPPQLS